MNALLGVISVPEMLAILSLALIIFAAKKLSGLARGFDEGIREFRKAFRDEIQVAEKSFAEALHRKENDGMIGQAIAVSALLALGAGTLLALLCAGAGLLFR
jgi:TatA/E family protein of Tat protein translocase